MPNCSILTLEEYLKKAKVESNDKITDELTADDFFDEFLCTTFAFLRAPDNHGHTLDRIKEEEPYELFIEQLINIVRFNGSSLKNYHTVKSVGLDESHAIRTLEDLKGKLWRQYCGLIGRHEFASLVLRTKGFLSLSTKLYFSLHNRFLAFQIKDDEVLSKNRMLYWRKLGRNHENILRSARITILTEIAPKDRDFKCNIMKRSRKLRKVLSRAEQKEVYLNYESLFDHLCKKNVKDNKESDFVSFHLMFEYCLSCLRKLFGHFVLGSQRNDKYLWQLTKDFLSSDKYMKVNWFSWLHKLNLEDIPWLDFSYKYATKWEKKFDFTLVLRFISWILQEYICKIIRRVCYVTEKAGEKPEKRNVFTFIPHHTWKQKSYQWIEEYKKLYLEQTSSNDSELIRHSHGNLRILPKKEEFRPLCIPDKKGFLEIDGHKISKNRDYKNYDKYVIRPARNLLRCFQSCIEQPAFYKKCRSSLDVLRVIKAFKDDFDIAPLTLSAVKFDMRHSFDNINQFHVVECVNELLSKFNEEEYFLEEQLLTHPTKGGPFKMLHNLRTKSSLYYTQKAEFLESKTHSAAVGMNRLMRIKRLDLVEIVKQHILHATTLIPGENYIYKRTRGVFQGLPLLGTFCDLVYDRIVAKCFESKNLHGKILIRLADDFLLISAEESDCSTVLKDARSQMAQNAGAYINEEKCEQYFSSHALHQVIDFVGIQIYLPSLDVYLKSRKVLRPPIRARHSRRYVLKYLEWIFDTRLPKEAISSFTNKELLKFSIEDVSRLVFSTLRQCLTKRNIPGLDKEELSLFYQILRFNLLKKLQDSKCSTQDIEIALSCFHKGFQSINIGV